MTEMLIFGVSIGLLGMLCSGALQAWTAFQQPAVDLHPEASPEAPWKAWALPATSVVVVPVAFLVYNTARTAAILATIADPVRSEDAALTYAGNLVGVESVGALSSRISVWLVITAIGGMAGALGLPLLGIVNIVLVGSRSVPRRPTMYSWVVFGVLCLSASVALVLLKR